MSNRPWLVVLVHFNLLYLPTLLFAFIELLNLTVFSITLAFWLCNMLALVDLSFSCWNLFRYCLELCWEMWSPTHVQVTGECHCCCCVITWFWYLIFIISVPCQRITYKRKKWWVCLNNFLKGEVDPTIVPVFCVMQEPTMLLSRLLWERKNFRLQLNKRHFPMRSGKKNVNCN